MCMRMKFTCIIYFIVRIRGKKIEIISSAIQNSTNPANWKWEKSGSYFFLLLIPMEEEMITHSSLLAWKTPWTEEPGGVQSMRPQSHDGVTEHMQKSGKK